MFMNWNNLSSDGSQSCNSRTPYPPIGGHAVTGGPKFSSFATFF